jgi:hypothetical protein
MAVTAGSVVEHLNVIEDIGAGQIPGFVDAFTDPFLFQAAEEQFRDSVIPAIAPPAHAGLKVMGLTKLTEVVDSLQDEII